MTSQPQPPRLKQFLHTLSKAASHTHTCLMRTATFLQTSTISGDAQGTQAAAPPQLRARLTRPTAPEHAPWQTTEVRHPSSAHAPCPLLPQLQPEVLALRPLRPGRTLFAEGLRAAPPRNPSWVVDGPPHMQHSADCMSLAAVYSCCALLPVPTSPWAAAKAAVPQQCERRCGLHWVSANGLPDCRSHFGLAARSARLAQALPVHHSYRLRPKAMQTQTWRHCQAQPAALPLRDLRQTAESARRTPCLLPGAPRCCV